MLRPPALLRTKASQINILQAIYLLRSLSHPYEELQVGRLKLMMSGQDHDRKCPRPDFKIPCTVPISLAVVVDDMLTRPNLR